MPAGLGVSRVSSAAVELDDPTEASRQTDAENRCTLKFLANPNLIPPSSDVFNHVSIRLIHFG